MLVLTRGVKVVLKVYKDNANTKLKKPMKAIIYQPTKNAMQSGKGNTKHWLLEFEQENSRYVEPIMGWTSNCDTKSQLKLKFKTKDDAIGYAKRKGIEYHVVEPNKPKMHIKAYADNFMK